LLDLEGCEVGRCIILKVFLVDLRAGKLELNASL